MRGKWPSHTRCQARDSLELEPEGQHLGRENKPSLSLTLCLSLSFSLCATLPREQGRSILSPLLGTGEPESGQTPVLKRFLLFSGLAISVYHGVSRALQRVEGRMV